MSARADTNGNGINSKPPVLTADEYLEIGDRLPAAPRILPRLLSVLADPESDVSQMIELISFDPGLTAKVLRASNSAFVGLPEPARDVGEAINFLGVNFVYQLAATACGSSTFQTTRGSGSADLWPHAVTAALAAQLLAGDLELDQGSLFTAALLHDIGQAVFAQKWKEDYWQMVTHTRQTPAQLLGMEEHAYELNHAELGGRLLARWKFPPSIAASVWHHHLPLPAMPFERETACVTLADAVAEAITYQKRGAAQLFPITEGQQKALSVFNFTGEDLNRYLGRTQENFEFVDAMCQIG